MLPTFTVNLSHRITPQLCAIGKFDGNEPSFVCASSADVITIHSPHDVNMSSRTLNINQPITSLCVGRMDGDSNDLLFVGTQSNMMVYDIERNETVFLSDTPGGVNTCCVGRIDGVPDKVLAIGGNCSLSGLDRHGKEVYWTVASDNVKCVVFDDGTAIENDENHDGTRKLIVGTDSGEIRVLRGQRVVSEICEAASIEVLHSGGGHLAFALRNGCVGVYDGNTRLWSMTFKEKATALSMFDIDGDGELELIIGWSDGTLHFRKLCDGAMVFDDEMSDGVAGFMVADYRMDGRDHLVCCASNGEMRGYVAEESGERLASMAERATAESLYERKQRLLKQIGTYETSLVKIKGTDGLNSGAVPPDTQLDAKVKRNASGSGVCMRLKTNNNTTIKGVIARGGGLFVNGQDCILHHVENPSPETSFDLLPPRNEVVDVMMQVIVGHRSSPHDHVFAMKCRLPRFSMYVFERRLETTPKSSVLLQCSGRASRVCLWLKRSFCIDEHEADSCLRGENLQASFRSIRDPQSVLSINVRNVNGGEIFVRTPDMELAGDVVQDLCEYLKITDIECVANFEDDIREGCALLTQVHEYQRTRQRLMVDTADTTMSIKNTLVRAEDARLIANPYMMRKMYQNVNNMNRDLVIEYTKRSNNHTELIKALRSINQMIQRAARLRVGRYSQEVITACREAIKSNSKNALASIISVGAGGGRQS